MVKDIASENENGRISNFEVIVTLTLTLDRVTLHTVVHHSSTSSCKPNFIEIKEFFLWTEERTHVRTFETGSIRSTLSKSRPNKCQTCNESSICRVQVHDCRVRILVWVRDWAILTFVTTSSTFNVLSSAWPCYITTVYILLHFRNASDKNFSDSLYLSGRIKCHHF